MKRIALEDLKVGDCFLYYEVANTIHIQEWGYTFKLMVMGSITSISGNTLYFQNAFGKENTYLQAGNVFDSWDFTSLYYGNNDNETEQMGFILNEEEIMKHVLMEII